MDTIGKRLRAGCCTAGALVALVALIAAPHPGLAALGDHVWSQGVALGGTSTVDATGHTVVASNFFGTIDLGGGPLTAQNSLTGDIAVVRYDSSGDFLWNLQFTPINQAGLFDIRLAASPNGRVYMSGVLFGSTIDFGGGPFTGANQGTAVLVCFDANGQHLWSFSLGSGSVLDLAATDAKLVGVGELRPGTGVDLGGGPLVSAGQEDVFVFELSPDGTHRWSKRFGDADRQSATAIAVGPSGEVVFGGGYFGTLDFGGGNVLSATGLDLYVTELDGLGSFTWSRGVTGTVGAGNSPRRAVDLALGSSGEVVFAGEFRTDIDLGGGPLVGFASGDAFVAHYGAAGGHEWSAIYGNTGSDAVTSVDVDTAGNVVLGGWFNGSVDLGGGPLPNTGAFRELFVGVFDPAGNHLFSNAYGSGTTLNARFDGANDIRLDGFGSNNDFGGGVISELLYLVKLAGTTNSPAGTNVPVVPVDQTTGDSPVAMTFTNISVPGTTSLTSSSIGPPPPGGLSFGSMATYYDLSTTSSFVGPIEVCFYYDPSTLPGPESSLTLQHYDASVPAWVDITTSVDTTSHILCGLTTSLSPFAIAAPISPTEAPSAPADLSLRSVPNPFNPNTTIRYVAPDSGGIVNLELFDAAGRKVRTLVARTESGGPHSVVWDGRDEAGHQAASGTYFARLRVDTMEARIKLVLLK